MRWLPTMPQDDGGWTIPTPTLGLSLKVMLTVRETFEPDRSRPSSHLVPGIVLRALAALPRYRHSADPPVILGHQAHRRVPARLGHLCRVVFTALARDRPGRRRQDRCWGCWQPGSPRMVSVGRGSRVPAVRGRPVALCWVAERSLPMAMTGREVPGAHIRVAGMSGGRGRQGRSRGGAGEARLTA
jgi:hypothetical protein